MSDFFISDLHAFHKRIIRLSQRRPLNRRDLFYDEYEMNDYIANKWNLVVGKNDIVHLLGDVAVCENASELKRFLKRLNGKIHLVTGNHDHYSQMIRDRLNYCNFASILDGVMLWDNRFLLSHAPVINPSHVNIHGHLHERPDPTKMHINVCVERWDYTPVPIEMIEKIVRERGL